MGWVVEDNGTHRRDGNLWSVDIIIIDCFARILRARSMTDRTTRAFDRELAAICVLLNTIGSMLRSSEYYALDHERYQRLRWLLVNAFERLRRKK